MYYTASSVQKAIMANEDLTIAGYLGCPQTDDWISDNMSCCKIPGKCPYLPKRECKQRINIYKGTALYVILTFYFTISRANLDGFIDIEDSMLARLMDKGLVNKKMLRKIPPR